MEEKKSKFVIEPSEAEILMREWNVPDIPSLLPILAATAQRLARPPISSFHVGVAAAGISGRIFLGVNVEFPKLPLHHSIHAEQFLLTNAHLHSETQILHLAVTAAPCGHCRQFMQELRNASRLQIQILSDPNPSYIPLIELLPRPFTPLDLLSPETPLLLEPQISSKRNLTLENSAWSCEMEKVLTEEAMKAVKEAYAPYSGCISGFAVIDTENRLHKGAYMESAAYNPSVGPVQAAMISYLVGGGDEWIGLVGGVLVEEKNARILQEGTVRAFFEMVAPEAKVWVHNFELES